MLKKCLLSLLWVCTSVSAQDYFLKKYEPYDPKIPSPEAFLEYGIGEKHTRHDLIVSYLMTLAELSDRASIEVYGRSHEGRKLVILTISSSDNVSRLPEMKKEHLAFTDPALNPTNYEALPIFINMGYNVHGNEPSGGEAALLMAYTMVASEHPTIKKYRENSIIFLDPVINPDGRDSHTHWVSMYQGSPNVADPSDAEHNESWPRGRTNHYWFDMNRDWYLGIHPGSRGKLNWYHQWYPNVVTDFHEMGSQSTYFFEPMKTNGSLNPIMPKENYEDLNELFGTYFSSALDSVGTFYFTKEVFDGTYPGYGSSYPDLQGGLALLFEQASSRGHVQTSAYGEITFPYTIRNQYITSIATVEASVENKAVLRKYQQDFFKSALSNAAKSKVRGYRFNKGKDANRTKAFLDKLLLHKVEVLQNGDTYTVPTRQPQHRMVQSVFETYTQYQDSVFYDASSWSLGNFYNIDYKPVSSTPTGTPLKDLEEVAQPAAVTMTDYAYIMDYNDYNAVGALYAMQKQGLVVASAFKPFSAKTSVGEKAFDYGAMILPVPLQKKDSKAIFDMVKKVQETYQVPIYAVATGYSTKGIDLGSRNVRPLKQPKAALVIGEGVSSYEAGEVWHLLDKRIHMPITKIPTRYFERVDLDKYNTLVMVSGSYSFSNKTKEKLKAWVGRGNTLVTIGRASKWVIDQKLVKEKLTESKKDTTAVTERLPYVDAPENRGKEYVGGSIFEVDLDTTHPLAFGYTDKQIPVYKNNTVWLAPTKSSYATVAKYSKRPRIDGFITQKNLEEKVKPSASLIVSKIGSGRVVLFADNPNFRGSWYGTNRLFLNALFLGDKIYVPE